MPMPHFWTETTDGKSVTLRPHTSLPRKGFAMFIWVTFVALIIPLFGLLGTPVLWGILPFVLLVLVALWIGLQHSYKSAELREVLTITASQTHLIRYNPRREDQTWDCNTHWVKPALHPHHKPHPFYLTLRGNARTVELGTFLTPDERKRLFSEISEVLKVFNAPNLDNL